MFKCIQVGVGEMGRGWLHIITKSKEVEHAAIADTNKENLQHAIKTLNIDPSKAFNNHQEAFEKTEADFALIVTPPSTHKEIALEAYRNGLHVLTEKPMADTMEACKEMVEGARRAGVRLMVSQNYRFQRWVRTARHVLQNGTLGRLSHVAVSFRRNPDWGPWRQKMDDPLLIEMSIHHFDMMRYILDRNPVEVYALTWNPKWSWFKGDCAAVVPILMEQETPVLYEGSVVAFGSHTEWDGQWRIECEKGALHFEDEKLFIRRHDSDQREEVPLLGMSAENQEYALMEFLASFKEGREAETCGKDNLYSLAMVFAAIDSKRMGEPRKIRNYL